MARALCSLNARCRWAVTGTPIQNRLKDFSALLKFLQAHPYSDQKQFDRDISNLWKAGDVDEATKRLKRLSRCLLLRRPQGTVKLPPRKDLQCTITFTRAERELYDDIRSRAIQQIDEARFEVSDAAGSNAYINVLQQIEAMRMVCNLGLHYHYRHDESKTSRNSSTTWEDWNATAQQIFNLHRSMEPIHCHLCSLSLDTIERLLVHDDQNQHQPRFSSCLRLTCADCVYTRATNGNSCGCGKSPSCAIAPVSASAAGLEETPVPTHLLEKFQRSACMKLPAKVVSLVTDLRALPLEVKW